MAIMLIFALGRVIMIPSPVVKLCGKSFVSTGLKVHQIFMGKSPLVIEQIADTESSRFSSSSPKLKGMICGTTKGILNVEVKIAKF
jgi:hypothetical protein